MAHYAYERLSGLDTSFLLLESQDVYTHVASTLVFEARSLRLADGGIDFQTISKAHEALLDRVPRYRQVLRFTPVTGQPVWVDDARFDLSYHLRHASLPRPGSAEQLKRLSARVMQQHLDRSRPLWETWVVEGLEGARFALIAKIHHCMIDGMAGIDLLQLLLSPEPDAPVPSAPRAYEPRPEPRPWQLLRDDLARRARLPVDAARDLLAFLERADDARREIQARARGALATLGMAVQGRADTPLNQPVGPHRRFDWWTVDLASVRDVKMALGGTINDVVLAIATSAFRRFLLDRGVDVKGLDFRTLAPVSVRRDDERGTLGNRISGWILTLPLGERSPKRRLRRIAEQTAALKTSGHALGAELLTGVVDWAPATLLSLGARAAARSLPFNTIVTNVPGPQAPMYLQGARLHAAYPQVPLVDRVDIGIALMSYAGQLHWGINSDYDAVPDLSTFRRALEQSFEELHRAVQPRRPRDVSVPTEISNGAAHHEGDAIQLHREMLTERARARHDALSAAIARLERALAAPAPQREKPWSQRVATDLLLVRDAIRAHVHDAEESRGLFEEVPTSTPRLSSLVTALMEEHASLTTRAAALAERLAAGSAVDFGALRREAAGLLADLRAHQAAEADLLYEAFWVDLGGD